jgi:hypothetical protein
MPPSTRCGVAISAFKARIFDIIQRAGVDGIAAADLAGIIYGRPDRGALKSHVRQINDALEDTGIRIRNRDRCYRIERMKELKS